MPLVSLLLLCHAFLFDLFSTSRPSGFAETLSFLLELLSFLPLSFEEMFESNLILKDTSVKKIRFMCVHQAFLFDLFLASRPSGFAETLSFLLELLSFSPSV